MSKIGLWMHFFGQKKKFGRLYNPPKWPKKLTEHTNVNENRVDGIFDFWMHFFFFQPRTDNDLFHDLCYPQLLTNHIVWEKIIAQWKPLNGFTDVGLVGQQFDKDHLVDLQSTTKMFFGSCYHSLIIIRLFWAKVITWSICYCYLIILKISKTQQYKCKHFRWDFFSHYFYFYFSTLKISSMLL